MDAEAADMDGDGVEFWMYEHGGEQACPSRLALGSVGIHDVLW